MFVVVWEPKGGGGGHQVALSWARAEAVHRALCRAMPDAECRIVGADDHAAAAVAERLGRAVPGGGIMDARPRDAGRRARRRRGLDRRL